LLSESKITVFKAELGKSLSSIFSEHSVADVLTWAVESAKFHIIEAPKELYKFSKKMKKHIIKLEKLR
jgi:hypothetical protein